MVRNYVGLAVTFHDPAVAVVNSRGEVTFAEASERHLQVKRALFQPPDDLAHIASILERYCEPGAELVVAHSWLRRQWRSVLARGYFTVSRDRTSPLLLPQVEGHGPRSLREEGRGAVLEAPPLVPRRRPEPPGR